MTHIKNIKNLSNGKLEITSRHGYIVEVDKIKIPETDNSLLIAELILQALENATLTLDPKTNTIKISFKKEVV
jgi:hypothetical protein